MRPRKPELSVDNTLHAIIAGVLMNGFIQGQTQEKVNTHVIDVALKEVKKLIKKIK